MYARIKRPEERHPYGKSSKVVRSSESRFAGHERPVVAPDRWKPQYNLDNLTIIDGCLHGAQDEERKETSGEHRDVAGWSRGVPDSGAVEKHVASFVMCDFRKFSGNEACSA